MTTHELKCWPEPFSAVIAGTKRHEVRRADRDFKVGDVLQLREWDPSAWGADAPESNANGAGKYTGRSAEVRVTYVSAAGTWGLPADLCVLSIALLNVLTVTTRGKCCELDTDGDGDCPIHEAPGVPRSRARDRDRIHRTKGPGRR